MNGLASKIFQLFSLVTTGIGLYPLMLGQTAVWMDSDLYSQVAAATVTALLTTAIQIGLTAAWMSFFARPLTRAYMLLLAMTLSLASGAFAAGTWTAFLDASGVKERLTADLRSDTIGPLRAYARKYDRLAAEASQLSKLAARKQKNETASGGSCDDEERAIKGIGDKSRLRDAQRTTFDTLAEATRQLSIHANEIAISVSTSVSDAQVVEAYKEGQRLAFDPAMSGLRTTVAQQLDGLGNGWRSQDGKRTFVCQDRQLQAALLEMQDILQSGLELPDAPPTSADVDFLDTLAAARGTIAALLEMATTGREPDNISANIVAAIVVAGFIELVIIFFLSADNGIRRELGTNPTRLELFLSGRRTYRDEEYRRHAREFAYVASLMVHDGEGSRYFAVPIDGDIQTLVEGEQIAQSWRMKPDKQFGDGVDLSRIDPDWVQARSHIHGGARSFRLFVVTRQIMEHLSRLARDIGRKDPPESA